MKNTSSETSIEQRLSGSLASRFWRELFRNTGQYPIAIVLIESLTEKWAYLTKPDLYALTLAAALQAYWFARSAERRPPLQRFLGNLIAPAVYSFNEIAIEGAKFFNKPHHVIFWIFAALVGLLDALQSEKPSFSSNVILIIKNVVYSQILFASYIIFESYTNPTQTMTLKGFFNDPSHVFIGLATLILGLSSGAADVNARSYLLVLQETTEKLKTYSEWLLGKNLLGRAIDDPRAMRLSRQTRTVIFMDIRGFTHWSETRAPEVVADLLNDYYLSVERVLETFQVIKYKFTADEVMAVFITADEALRAAVELRARVSACLKQYQLGAGMGVHSGTLVEGLLGAHNIRFYDVIGDTVNTASRIEKDSAAGEIWASESVCAQLPTLTVGAAKDLSVKGKDAPLRVYLLAPRPSSL